MNCPRDNSILDSVKKGQLDINVCSECNGFSVSLRQDAALALSKQLANRIAASQPEGGSDRLASPFTGQSMSRFTYRGVELDYCQLTSSVWFDRGEYSEIFRTPVAVSKPVSGAGEAADGWEVLDKVGTTVFALDIVGDLVEDVLTGIEISDLM